MTTYRAAYNLKDITTHIDEAQSTINNAREAVKSARKNYDSMYLQNSASVVWPNWQCPELTKTAV
jgi:hypothetical protein